MRYTVCTLAGYWQLEAPQRRYAPQRERAPDSVRIPTLVPAAAPPVITGGGSMRLKQIDTCIDQLRKILGDTNNELTSKQRSKLKKGIDDLKRLQRETKLTQKEVFAVVSRIAKDVFELLKSGQSE
jgi:hypothetical protein